MRSCVAADGGADSVSIGLSHSDTLTVASKIIADVACDWGLVANNEILFVCPENSAAVKRRLNEGPNTDKERVRAALAYLDRGIITKKGKEAKEYKNGKKIVKYIPEETPEGYVEHGEYGEIGSENEACPSMMLKIHRELKGLISQENFRTFYEQQFYSILERCNQGFNDFRGNILGAVWAWADPHRRLICVNNGSTATTHIESSTRIPCTYQSVMFNPVLHPTKHFLGKDVNRPFKMIYPAGTPARDKLIQLLSEDIGRDLTCDRHEMIDQITLKKCDNDETYRNCRKELDQALIARDAGKEEASLTKLRRLLQRFREEVERSHELSSPKGDKLTKLYKDFKDLLQQQRALQQPETLPAKAQDMKTIVEESIEKFIPVARAYFETMRNILISQPDDDFENINVEIPTDEIDPATSSSKLSGITDELKLMRVSAKRPMPK